MVGRLATFLSRAGLCSDIAAADRALAAEVEEPVEGGTLEGAYKMWSRWHRRTRLDPCVQHGDRARGVTPRSQGAALACCGELQLVDWLRERQREKCLHVVNNK